MYTQTCVGSRQTTRILYNTILHSSICKASISFFFLDSFYSTGWLASSAYKNNKDRHKIIIHRYTMVYNHHWMNGWMDG